MSQRLVVDAIEAGAVSGTVFRLRGEDLMPEPGAAVSLHQLGFVESLAMARQLDCAPIDVVVIGVQPSQIRAGLELSPDVKNAIPRAITAVRSEIRSPHDTIS